MLLSMTVRLQATSQAPCKSSWFSYTTQQYPPKPTGYILVECTPIQQQEGQYDCGLFAVAFAYHLAVGDDVKSMALDQHKLRNI